MSGLLLLTARKGAAPSHLFGPVPTRDQVCGGQHRFQGMSVILPPGSTYDPLRAKFWFDPLINDMTDLNDRLAVYKAHRDVGDTVLNLSMGLDGLAGLPRLIDIATEAVTIGGLTSIILMCMGDGHGNPNSDPGALGHDWLMANFPAIYAMVRAKNTGDPNNSLAHRTEFCPGYDGIIPDWQPPSAVDRFLLMARETIDQGGAGYLTLELSAGFCKWGTDSLLLGALGAVPMFPRASWKYAALQGRPEPAAAVPSHFRSLLASALTVSGWANSEDNNWITRAGKCVDRILQEGPIDMGPPVPVPQPPPFPDNYTQVYQIVGRMVKPYYPVPGQTDDLHPPFLLYDGTPRGEFKFDWWEWDTYLWTLPWRRGGGGMTAQEVETHRQAGYAMGCRFVG